MDTRIKHSKEAYLMSGIRKLWSILWRILIEPKSLIEDDRRREFILNVILSSSLVLFIILDGLIFADYVVSGPAYRGLPLPVFSLFVVFLAALLFLSRAGYFRFSVYIILILFFSIITYAAVRWGMDLPAVLLGYALVITVAGILVSTKFGVWTACIGVIVLAVLGFREINSGILTDNYWKNEVLNVGNIIEYSVMLLFLTLVSALSNREITKSLLRARSSEEALKQERDNLEATVEDRTRELRESQLRQLSEHSQFVELGRLAGGYIHDLANPLTVLSLSIEDLNNSHKGQAVEALDSAMRASKRLDVLLNALRKQIRQDDKVENFSVNQEMLSTVQLLEYKAKTANVRIVLNLPLDDIKIKGSPVKFHQIATNLIDNGIESFATSIKTQDNIVEVNLFLKERSLVLKVIDNGCGIAINDLARIFEPFYTTKGERGLGIGLPTIKTIIEKDFDGSVTVLSDINQGTVFTVVLSLN